MESTSSGCYVVDSEYNVVNINAVAKDIYPQLEIGRKCYQCLMQLDRPCSMCPVLNHVQGSRTYTDPIRHITETVDAVDIEIPGHGLCHALIFSTVGTDADFASTLPTSAVDLRMLALVRALTIDFCDVFSVSLADGSVTVYRHNNQVPDRSAAAHLEKSYLISVESYIQKYVRPNDQDMMRRRCSLRYIKEELQDKEYFDLHYHVLLDGQQHYYYRRIARIGSAENFSHFVVGVACEDDIVINRKKHEQLEQNLSKVEYDNLTGLYTREAFYIHGAELLKRHPELDFDFCILKIENLGLINQQFGHGAGDKLIELIGHLLKQYECDTNCITYIGDGVYASFTENTTTQVRKDNIHAFQNAIVNNTDIRSLSLKWSVYKAVDREMPIEEIFEKTVYALSTIRTNMHEDYVEFDLAMMDRMEWEESIVQRFSGILESGQFAAWYQPKYSTITKEIVGAEALARWTQPDGTMVSPTSFIPMLENSGKIGDLDLYMFRQVCIMQRKIMDSGLQPLPISVNLSRASIFSEDIVGAYSRIAAEYGISPNLLPIEITETAATRADVIQELSKELIAKGFALHMDDFGVGYSSLSSLQSIPFKAIKFDKELIDYIGTIGGENLLRHTMAFAKEAGKITIAEGVESYEQYMYLKFLGCDVIQGFYFSKPVEAETYMQLLRDSQEADSQK